MPRAQSWASVLSLPPPLTRMGLRGHLFNSLMLVPDAMFHIPHIFIHSTWSKLLLSASPMTLLPRLVSLLTVPTVASTSPVSRLRAFFFLLLPAPLLLPPHHTQTHPCPWRVAAFSWYYWRRTFSITSVTCEEQAIQPPSLANLRSGSISVSSLLLYSTSRPFLFNSALKVLSSTIHTPSLHRLVTHQGCGHSTHAFKTLAVLRLQVGLSSKQVEHRTSPCPRAYLQ